MKKSVRKKKTKMKTINVCFESTSNRKAKELSRYEVKLSDILKTSVNCKYAMPIFVIDGGLYACKMPIDLLFNRIAFGKANNKFLSPLGKNQVKTHIASGELEKIGETADLDYYIENPRYKTKSGKLAISNYGQAVEYYLAKKYHAKFDHYGKMTEGEFRGCEVKLFNFDKTTGTPSATCESTKTILMLAEELGL